MDGIEKGGGEGGDRKECLEKKKTKGNKEQKGKREFGRGKEERGGGGGRGCCRWRLHPFFLGSKQPVKSTIEGMTNIFEWSRSKSLGNRKFVLGCITRGNNFFLRRFITLPSLPLFIDWTRLCTV